MNKMQDYNIRKAYVEITLANTLRAMKEFDFIRFVKDFRTEEEYIRIGDLRGCTVTFDVTACPLDEVMRVVCDYAVSGPLGGVARTHIVCENDKLLSIARLFKGVE